MKIPPYYALIFFGVIVLVLCSFFGYAEYIRGGTSLQIVKQVIFGFTCGVVIDIGLFFRSCYIIYHREKKSKIKS